MKILLYVGIDVAKEFLVICLKRKGRKDLLFRVANDEQGIAQLVEVLGADISSAAVRLEATSRFHRLAARMLSEAGAAVEVMNPMQARALAIGLGIIDKDDELDASVLARSAQLVAHKASELRSEAHEELRDLSRLIGTLTTQNAENKKRLGALSTQGAAHRLLKQTIELLAKQIAALKAEWKQLCKQELELQRRFKLSCSVGDVGDETARVVACELPATLSEHQIKQICAYAGVVPRRSQSGSQKERSSIGKRGNSHLRTGLFMAAIHSVFQGKRNKAFYDRLMAKGRTHLQAMIAVMHKLLREILAVLKRDSPWKAEPPSNHSKKISEPLLRGATT